MWLSREWVWNNLDPLVALYNWTSPDLRIFIMFGPAFETNGEDGGGDYAKGNRADDAADGDDDDDDTV